MRLCFGLQVGPGDSDGSGMPLDGRSVASLSRHCLQDQPAENTRPSVRAVSVGSSVLLTSDPRVLVYISGPGELFSFKALVSPLPSNSGR